MSQLFWLAKLIIARSGGNTGGGRRGKRRKKKGKKKNVRSSLCIGLEGREKEKGK